MDRIWEILKIDATEDKREIKRAYARLSREIHPEERPEEFQRLYDAYQRALQYASYMEKRKDGMTEAEAMPEPVQEEEGRADAEKWDRYERFGFEAEDAQKEQLRLEKIEYFLYHWERKAHEGVETGTFLTEDWKAYLESAEFREIMWGPIILRTIAEGIEKYFLRKEEILLFFWNLYGFEELKEKPCREEELLLYETLYRVYKNRIIRQKYAEKMVEDLKKRQKFRKKIVIICICALIGLIPVMIIVELFMMLLGISGGMADTAVIGIFAAAFCAVVLRLVTGYIDGE